MPLKNLKIERSLTAEELPAFLRNLADLLESPCDEESCSEGIDLSALRTFKLGVRQQDGHMDLKFKIKHTKSRSQAPAADEAVVPSLAGNKKAKVPARQAPLPKNGGKTYKTLKKRMKTDFRAILTACDKDTMPPAETVDFFLQATAHMLAIPGFGDERYDEFARATASFQEAFLAGDREKTCDAATALDALKTRCHKQFK